MSSDIECHDYHNYPSNETCHFVTTVDDCQMDQGFIPYLSFIFCSFPSDLFYIPLIIMFIWVIVLFVASAKCADEYLCIDINVISKALRFSENVAGVTLIAFGNGAADIFTAIAAIGSAKNGDASLAFGALLGAGMFITCIVAGTVIVLQPFQTPQRPFLRDIVFYIAALFWSFKCLWDGVIHLSEAIGFIVLYCLYVVVVIGGRYFRRMMLRRTDDGTRDTAGLLHDSVEPLLHGSSVPVNYGGVASINDDKTENGRRGDAAGDDVIIQEYTGIRCFFSRIVSGLWPIDAGEWREASKRGRLVMIIAAPVRFLFNLTIPVVNEERADHNWNKGISCLHLFTVPLFCAFVLQGADVLIGNVFPVWALLPIVSFVLMLVVIFTSNQTKPPIYHSLFAFAGFVVAVIWLYMLANEIVNILQSYGIVFNLSNGILGLTLLAWGNSLQDLIVDTTMARQGQPLAGFSACYGGPLFNILLGLGIPFTLSCIQTGHSFQIKNTLLQTVLSLCLALSLLSTIIWVPIAKFNLKRSFGIFIIGVYLATLLVVILIEVGVIQYKI